MDLEENILATFKQIKSHHDSLAEDYTTLANQLNICLLQIRSQSEEITQLKEIISNLQNELNSTQQKPNPEPKRQHIDEDGFIYRR